ncbi:oleate hydratase [Streptomyces sp. NPDC059389]|uniref:oleate hydratase n=1 Tax=Streptomyces sp. NPDC059389 TaxID=3346818 RepID=UPI0036762064
MRPPGRGWWDGRGDRTADRGRHAAPGGFVHLFKTFDTMSGIYRTRLNQYDSIVRPLRAWLRSQGVTFAMNTTVTDAELAEGEGVTVTSLTCTRGGTTERIPVAPEDLVFVTNGSMTARSALGSTDTAAVPDTSVPDASWLLWHALAAKRPHLGDPSVFDSSVADSTWGSFTVTTRDPTFFKAMEEFSGSEAGKGGLITFKDSSWLLTIVLNHQPHFREQPQDTYVWWGYALFPDKAGDHVGKTTARCTGREVLTEVLGHLRLAQSGQILESSVVRPALMPYITSQFLVRKAGDRPDVVPEGSTNLAFIGQYAEVPDDVVFTVEYSVRTAWTAVAGLLHLDRRPPPVHKGAHDPKVLLQALHTMHRR